MSRLKQKLAENIGCAKLTPALTVKNSEKTVRLKTYNKCNNNCIFCGILNIKAKEFKTFNQIQDELLRLKNENVNHIVFPCNTDVRKDFFFVLRYAKSLGFKISLETNGRIFSYATFSEISSKLIDKYHFLLSGRESVHNSMSNINSYSQTISGIKNIKLLGKEIQINCVISNKNLNYLEDVVELCNELKVKRLWFIFPILKEENVNIPDIFTSYQKIHSAICLAEKKGIEIISGKIFYNPFIPDDLNLDYGTAQILFEKKKDAVKKKVSVIIPTYNRKTLLELTLISLFHQNYPKTEYEIIIIDDGSSDNTQKMVKNLKNTCNFKYIYWPRKKPFILGSPENRAGPARNIGIMHSEGELLLFIDSDNICPPDLIHEHINSHKEENMLVCGIRKDLAEIQDVPKQKIIESIKSGKFNEIKFAMSDKNNSDELYKTYEEIQYDFFKSRCAWRLFTTNNASVFRKHVSASEFFDKNFVHWGMEDNEFAYRLYKKGLKIFLNKNAVALHQFHEKELKYNRGIIKIQHTTLYKLHLDRDILFWSGKFLFIDNEYKKLIHKKYIIEFLVLNYDKFSFLKTELNNFFRMYLDWQNKEHYTRKSEINVLCTNGHYLVKKLNSGYFKNKNAK